MFVYDYDVDFMTKKSKKFCHKAVKFKSSNKDCNVVVSKEFEYNIRKTSL